MEAPAQRADTCRVYAHAMSQETNAARRWWIALAAILCVGFAARFLYLWQAAALPFFDHPVGDSAAHLKRAAEIASGSFLPSRPFYYCSIFYPYFLAATLALFHGSLFAVCLIQVVAGTAVVGLIAVLARRLFGPAAGLIAGAIAAFYGPFAFLEADLLGVAWGQLALVLGMLAAVRWTEAEECCGKTPAADLGLAGLAFGLAVTERPNLLVVAGLVGLWCVVRVGARRALRPALALAGGVTAPLAVVLALNVAGSGQWVPLTISAGINLSLGYHAGANGTFEEPWEKSSPHFAALHPEPEEAMTAMASAEVGRTLTPREASAYWGRKAMEFIRTHPAEAARVTFRRAALMLNAAEVPNHLDYEFMRARAPALWLMPIGFGAVLALAAIGIGDAFRRRGDRSGVWLLVMVSAGVLASVLPFTVADRYRAPMVPALIVAAGGGVVALARLARESRTRVDRGALAVLAGSLVAALIAMVPLTRALPGRNYWMLADAYRARGDLNAAIAAYEVAVRAEGSDGSLLNNLAMAYRARGDRARAAATLRRAIAVAPGLAYPHKNLGMLLVVQGDANGALAELYAAQRIEPGDASTAAAIGALLAERGETRAAAAQLARALELAPDDTRLRSLVSRYTAVMDESPARGGATP